MTTPYPHRHGPKGLNRDHSRQMRQVVPGAAGHGLHESHRDVLPLHPLELEVHHVIDGVFREIAQHENPDRQCDA
jgi:hypothetical protein